MIRTVLIDDEPVLLRSLQKQIEAADKGFSVVGTANDGVNAFSLIKNLQPDLAFIDISMPVMDGLQLIELLRHENIDIQVVILSGYKEFEYAKKAVKLDVADYLVKPINPIEFSNILLSVRERIYSIRKNAVQAYIGAQLKGEAPQDISSWAVNMETICVKICFGMVHYLRKVGLETENSDLYFDKLNIICRNVIKNENGFWLETTKYSNEFLLVLNTSLTEAAIYTDNIFEQCRQILPGNSITFAVHQSFTRINEIKNVLKELDLLLYEKAVFAKSKIIKKDDSLKAGNTLQNSDIAAIVRAAKIGERPAALKLLHGILLKCEKAECTQTELVALLIKIVSGVNKSHKSTSLEFKIGYALEKSKNYDELAQNIEGLLFPSEQVENDADENLSTSDVVDEIAAYLSENAYGKISLQKVAETYGFSYTYLSYVFKKQTGYSPNEFVIRCRMEQAKKLLSAPGNRSIKFISLSVGYSDQYYFSRLFKASTGYAPSDYRRIFFGEAMLSPEDAD